MASLLTPIDDETDPTNSQATTTTSTSGAPAATGTTTTGGTTTPTAPVSPGVNGTTTGQGDISAITAANQGVDFSPLINYVSGEGTKAKSAIDTANTNFTNTLGTFAPFGTDQQNTLNSVLSGTTPLDTGKTMLANTYTPTQIDNATYDPLTQQYSTDAASLGNASGISSLLSTLRPDLTPGDLTYDATVFGGEPAYQTAAQAQQANANAISDLGANSTSNAASAIKQRQSDVSAFNTAAQGYVQSQADAINQAILNQEKAAQDADQSVLTDYGNLQSGKTAWGTLPASEFAFDPTAYQPTTFTSQYGPSVYNQTINPASYLNYIAGQGATQNNVATADQATQYNNAEALLNAFGKITPGSRQAAQLGINQQALAAALAQAQLNENAADAAWLAAHQPAAPAAPIPAAPQPSNPGAGEEGSGGGESSGESSEGSGQGGEAEGGDAGGESEAGSGSEGGGGDDGEFKGGFVKPMNRRPRASNPLSKLSTPNGPVIGPPDSSQSALANNPALMAALNKNMAAATNPVITPAASTTPTAGYFKGGPIDARIGRVQGGYVPVKTGRANAIDDIQTKVSNGEFVTRQPSVAAIGPANMVALNKMNSASPHNQALVRNALHSALARARIGSR